MSLETTIGFHCFRRFQRYIFKAIHNQYKSQYFCISTVSDDFKNTFLKQFTTVWFHAAGMQHCFRRFQRYIFKAIHNCCVNSFLLLRTVSDDFKDTFLKQFTTGERLSAHSHHCFRRFQRYIFKAIHNLHASVSY